MGEKKIKVAQVIGNIAEGGIEVMITNLYRNIDHEEVEFHFFVPNTSVVLNQEEIEKYGGKVFIVPSVKHIFKYQKTLKRKFKENKYDIVHVNMNALSFIPLKAAKKAGIPIRISHCHSTTNKKEHIRHLIKLVLRPFSRKDATHFFACSEFAGRWLFGNKLFNKNKVYIVNNGIDLNKFAFNEQKRDLIRKQLGISPNIKVVGHIGRFAPQKNHPYLIKIYEELSKIDSEVALLMIGSGKDLDNIKAEVENKHLKNVHFVGPISNPYDYYQAMDVFALPSLYEGLPVVGVEAQANGLKCFFSDEITREAKILDQTEYFGIKGDPAIWAEKIENYFKNRKTIRDLNNSFASFDIKAIAANMLEKYKEYLKE